MSNNQQRIFQVLANSQITSTPTTSCYVDNVDHVTFQVRGLSNSSSVIFEGSQDGPANAPSPPTFFSIQATNVGSGIASISAYSDGIYTFATNGLHEVRANLSGKRDTVPVTITVSGN